MTTTSPIFSNMIKDSTLATNANTTQQKSQKLNINDKKDTFSKTTATTAGGVASGGIIGILKEKLMPKKIPTSISTQDDESALDQMSYKKFDSIINDSESMLKESVNKILNNQELTKEEVKFLDGLDLIYPNDLKFMPFVKEFAEEIVSSDYSNGGNFLGSLNLSYPSSGLTRGISMYSALSDRLEDILQDGGKYTDNEEFLDYINSRFFKGETYKTLTNTANGKTEYVFSDFAKEALKKDEILSSENYNFKEIVNLATGKNSSAFMDILMNPDKMPKLADMPIVKYERKVRDLATQQAKAEVEQLKKTAITNFQNKQILKSAGIGAGIIGILTICGTLIYKKIKQNKESN